MCMIFDNLSLIKRSIDKVYIDWSCVANETEIIYQPHPLKFYLVTLSPFIPLPLNKGKGEVFSLEGQSPSKTPLITTSE